MRRAETISHALAQSSAELTDALTQWWAEPGMERFFVFDITNTGRATERVPMNVTPGPNLRLLIDRDFYASPAQALTSTDPLLTAYASGDTGVAAVIEPGQTYQVALAAATYTWGQEVVVAAAGRAAGAASSGVVVGFTRFAGAKSAGDLGDIEFCMPYVKP